MPADLSNLNLGNRGTNMANDGDSPRLIAETKFLRFVERGRWSFVQRTNSAEVVCILAVTQQQRLILVEQYRPPVRRNVIELPAGLAGDIPGQQDEILQAAAARELLEETGYEADQWQELAPMCSSAGLTDEVVTMFRASGLRRTADGGGDADEEITVHEISLTEVDRWLAAQIQAGLLVDGRVFAALHFAK